MGTFLTAKKDNIISFSPEQTSTSVICHFLFGNSYHDLLAVYSELKKKMLNLNKSQSWDDNNSGV